MAPRRQTEDEVEINIKESAGWILLAQLGQLTVEDMPRWKVMCGAPSNLQFYRLD